MFHGKDLQRLANYAVICIKPTGIFRNCVMVFPRIDQNFNLSFSDSAPLRSEDRPIVPRWMEDRTECCLIISFPLLDLNWHGQDKPFCFSCPDWDPSFQMLQTRCLKGKSMRLKVGWFHISGSNWIWLERTCDYESRDWLTNGLVCLYTVLNLSLSIGRYMYPVFTQAGTSYPVTQNEELVALSVSLC